MIFFDTNVVIDLLDEDRPSHREVMEVFQAINEAEKRVALSWHTLSTIDYILSQRSKWNEEKVKNTLEQVIEHFEIPSVGKAEARKSLNFSNGDFEDAMQIVSAIVVEAEFILTRDEQGGFEKSPIQVLSPALLLEKF